MNAESRVSVRRGVAVVLAIALLAMGAGGAYLWMRIHTEAHGTAERTQSMRGMSGGEPGAGTANETAAGTGANARNTAERAVMKGPLPDVVVTLSEEAVERAGIEVTPVITRAAGARVRVAGAVEPNAYRQVTVTPLVGGRITRVLVELGDRVRRGQTIAQVYSPELAEAQTQYLSFVADLDAAHQQLRRTERLVEIGAASRQELEKVRAEHTSHASHVEGARSRLILLGMTPAEVARLSSASEVTATTDVPAPLAGVVTRREANPGLNVDPSTTLFTIVDLSTVWVVGDLYEKDFSRVRVGSPATITTTAYPDLALQGRVSYIDPQVNPDTRTARVRVEVSNSRGELRLGMYADMQVGESGNERVAIVPKTAVQNVGDRQVVYLVNPKERGRFIEREVHVGDASGEQVEVLSGVQPGDIVVAEGSFFIRAERERLGLRQPAGTPTASGPGRTGRAPAAAPRQTGSPLQTARVTVSDRGYEPSKLTLRAGVPARLTFVRTSDKTCGTDVVFPSLNLRRALPLNEPVSVELGPQKSGEIAFACGMGMLRGTIVVQ